MLHRGLSRIANAEPYFLVNGVTSVEAGAPVAGIFNNASLKLEAATNAAVDTTLAHWQFLGFAFNDYGKPSTSKFKSIEVEASDNETNAFIDVPAEVFDSSTTNLVLFANSASGKAQVTTAVDALTDLDADTEYFLDATNGKIWLNLPLSGSKITVQYHVALTEYQANLENQFSPNIFTNLVDKVNVITEAQTIAISSNFVNADGYVASGVYNKAPACYLTLDANNNFQITIGGSTGTQLKNLLFLGFDGDYAVFKLVPNSNIA